MTDIAKSLERVAGAPWRAALLIVGLSFVGASTLSTIVGQLFMPGESKGPAAGGAKAKPPAAVTLPTPATSLNQAAIDVIVKRNIFSSQTTVAESAAAVKAAGQAAAIVKSDLPFKLLGTIYTGDINSGIAIIENDTKKTVNSFMVGDALAKDALLKEIHNQRIVIDRGNGRLEFLEVVTEGLTRSRRNKKKAVVSTEQAVAPIATEPPPANFREDGFERKDREIHMTQSYRQKLLTVDFTKVLQDAKATPNMVDGELKGFVLTRIRKESIYEKAGLQNDDLVTEINGVPLTDTAQAIRLLQSLRNESEIEVRITRGGAPMKFNLNIR